MGVGVTQKIGQEFSIAAAIKDPLIAQKLIDLAQQGHHAVASPFVSVDAQTTQNGSTDEKQAQWQDLLRLVEMTEAQQRLAGRLEQLDRAAQRALDLNAEQLANARATLDLIRETAHRITLDDGSQIAVYRDGEDLRAEDGTILDPSLVNIDDVPRDAPDWDMFSQSRDSITTLETERDNILEFRETLGETAEFLETNPTDSVVADLESGLSLMPASIAAQLTATPVSPAPQQDSAAEASRPVQPASGAAPIIPTGP